MSKEKDPSALPAAAPPRRTYIAGGGGGGHTEAEVSPTVLWRRSNEGEDRDGGGCHVSGVS